MVASHWSVGTPVSPLVPTLTILPGPVEFIRRLLTCHRTHEGGPQHEPTGKLRMVLRLREGKCEGLHANLDWGSHEGD